MKFFDFVKFFRYPCLALAFFILMSCAGVGTHVQASGEQMLFVAVLQRNLVQTEKLLKEGASPNSRGVSGNTVLTTACHAGNGEMVDLLLRYNADPNLPNNDGTIPLNYAFKHNILKKLIDKGANVVLVSEKTGQTAFETWCANAAWVTSEAQKQSTMKILKMQKIKVDRAHLDKTQWVNEKDINEIIKLYLSHGYDINKSYNADKNMPIHFAAIGENYSLMRKLLAAGAKADFKNKYQEDPLSTITKIQNSKKTESEFRTVLSELLAAGADINTVDADGDTPLCNAADAGNLGKIKVILAVKGVDIHKTGNYGETALFRSKNLAMTKVLVTAGLKVNQPNKFDLTPLFSVHEVASVRYLIQKGANVNHVNDDNENTLLYNMHAAYDAIRYGSSSEAQTKKYIEKVKVLVNSGIDVNCKSKAGYSALYWAQRAELDKIVDILKKSGAR